MRNTKQALLLSVCFACSRLGATDIEDRYPVSVSREAHALGDFDADGDLDAVLELDALSLYLAINNGAGELRFSRCGSPGSLTEQLQLADADADGDLDIFGLTLFASDGDKGVFLIRTEGGECLSPERLTNEPLESFYVMGMRVADINHDNVPDLFVVGDDLMEYERRVRLLVNDGTGHFNTPSRPIGEVSGASLSAPIEVVDLDLDGNRDVLWMGTADDEFGGYRATVNFLLGDGAGGFQKQETRAAPFTGIQALCVGDLDQDERPDLVAVGATSADEDGTLLNRGRSLLFVLHNDPAQSFTRTTTLAGRRDYKDCNLVDLDQDGDLDILTNNFDYAMFRDHEGFEIIENHNGRSLERTRYLLGTLQSRGFTVLEAGDLDNNGVSELIGNVYTPEDELLILRY